MFIATFAAVGGLFLAAPAFANETEAYEATTQESVEGLISADVLDEAAAVESAGFEVQARWGRNVACFARNRRFGP